MQDEKKHRFFKHRMAVGVMVILLCAPSLSSGWAAGGHMMVAYLAYNRLNPRAKARANKLLTVRIGPAEVFNKSQDFVNAAHWADDLRPFAEFGNIRELHFIDTPLLASGRKGAAPTPNIVTALEDNLKILRTSTDEKAQAQALRLIIHFVGDIHQPLHCATRFDSTNPKGDQGGNLVWIMIPDQTGKLRKSNLHSFWDGGIDAFPKTGPSFEAPSPKQIPAAVFKAVADNPDTDPRLLDDPFNFSAWADESATLANEVAYSGIKNGMKPSATYIASSLKVARQRVAWGGYRLAALLNTIWP